MGILKRSIVPFLFLMFTVYFSIYIQVVTINLAWLTWFYHFGMVEKFLTGTLVFNDLINRYGEHGMLGYNILFLINVKFFKLNNFFDAYMNLLVIIFSTIIIYIAYKKSLSEYINFSLINKILFGSIVFIMFSIIQQSSGAMETQVRLGPLFFLLTCWLIDSYFFRNKNKIRSIFLIIIMIYVSVLIFGTMYSFAWIPLIIASGFIYYYINRKFDKGFIIIAIALLSSVIMYMYMYSLFTPVDGSGESFTFKILKIFKEPIKAFEFLLAFIGSGTLGRTLWEDRLISNNSIMLVNGIVIFIIYIASIVCFITSKMWKKTYLPLMLIGYTFGISMLIFIGRSESYEFATNYWYAVHTKFGLVGCIWILVYFVINYFEKSHIKNKKGSNIINKTIVINICFILIIMVSQIISNFAEWKRAPYVKQFYERMAPYAFTPYNLPLNKEGLTPLLNNLDDTLFGIELMKKYKLNIYHDFAEKYQYSDGIVFINGAIKNGILGEGWFGREGGQQWIGKAANITFKSGNEGKVIISGFIPEFLSPNEITIKVDNQVLIKSNAGGEFTIQTDISKDSIISMKIEVLKSIVPKEKGMGEDIRELAAIVNNITVK